MVFWTYAGARVTSVTISLPVERKESFRRKKVQKEIVLFGRYVSEQVNFVLILRSQKPVCLFGMLLVRAGVVRLCLLF